MHRTWRCKISGDSCRHRTGSTNLIPKYKGTDEDEAYRTKKDGGGDEAYGFKHLWEGIMSFDGTLKNGYGVRA
jgi:hypothetical protein